MRPRLFAFAISALLLMLGSLWCTFGLRNLDVSITLNNDGSAHVTESVKLFITGNHSIVLYEESSKYNDLSSWTTRTEIPEVSTHVNWGAVDILNLQVSPQQKFNCNMVANTCYGLLEISYDIYPFNSSGSGAQFLHNYKPRTTRYVFQPQILTFPRSKTGDILLAKDYALRISIPEDAVRISLSPVPTNLLDEKPLFHYDSTTNTTYYLGQKRQFAWSDPTLPKFSLAYEREEGLENEVLSYFSNTQRDVAATAFSSSGLAYFIAAIAILLSIFWLHSLGAK